MKLATSINGGVNAETEKRMVLAEPITDLQVHPSANLFPMFPDEELRKLADDIKAHGLREPITLYRGEILDGRNRLKACGMAGVVPRFETVTLAEGDSPTLWVVSKNLFRRHLKPGEQAKVALDMLPLLEEEAAKRKLEGQQSGGRGHKKTSVSFDTEVYPERRACNEAGEAVGLSGVTVYRAKKVSEADPEAFERVVRGEATVSGEYTKLKAQAQKKAPEKIPAPEPAPEPEPVRKHKGMRKGAQLSERLAHHRMVDIISHVRGLCRGLSELDVALASRSITSRERREWRISAIRAAKVLRAFAAKLRETEPR